MTTTTLTLAAFLEARLIEDEATALAAIPSVWWSEAGDGRWRFEAIPYEGERPRNPNDSDIWWDDSGWTEHAARHDPARVLAEVAAKRAIMAEHRLITDPARLIKVWRDPTPGVACERCANDPLGDAPLEDIGPCDTWLHLAAVYSDHADYDESWRP